MQYVGMQDVGMQDVGMQDVGMQDVGMQYMWECKMRECNICGNARCGNARCGHARCGNMWEHVGQSRHSCTLKNAKICARQQDRAGGLFASFPQGLAGTFPCTLSITASTASAPCMLRAHLHHVVQLVAQFGKLSKYLLCLDRSAPVHLILIKDCSYDETVGRCDIQGTIGKAVVGTSVIMDFDNGTRIEPALDRPLQWPPAMA